MQQVDIEAQIYSQHGEDGIIEFLLKHIRRPNYDYIDIGASDGRKRSNTYRLAKKRYRGFLIERRPKIAKRLRLRYEEEKLNFVLFVDFVTLKWLKRHSDGLPEFPDFLSLDIDSVDWYIMRAMLDRAMRPKVICVEYNASFGSKEALAVPYRDKWRIQHKWRNLYFGASYQAWRLLMAASSYEFVCCDISGTNMFFVDPHPMRMTPIRKQEWFGWRESPWSKNEFGCNAKDRLAMIRGLGLELVDVTEMV